jgi:hypothetical protein
MKKLKSLFVIAGIIALASCVKPSEKASGNYNGTATVLSTDYSGTTGVTANGDDKVNITTTANSVTYTANGVSASLSNDVVTLTYSSTTTTAYEVTALSGNVTNNTLNYTATVMVSNPFTTTVVFTGTK